MPLVTLDQALQFSDSDVVERFCDHLDVPDEDARVIFSDVIRWLWLSASAQADYDSGLPAPKRLTITDPMAIVDEMWHHFICCTKNYDAFCRTHLGTFVHHVPTSKVTRARALQFARTDPEAHRAKRRLQYEYICAKLGRETLFRWYVRYPTVYSKTRILELRKK